MGSLYSEHLTWLHRVGAGWKLLALTLLSTGLFLIAERNVLALAALLAALLLASLGAALTGARKALVSIGVTAVVVSGFHAALGQTGIGLVSALRLATSASLGVALTLTTRHGDLLNVFERVLTPLRWVGWRPQRLALQLALMLRFTEHFFVLWQRLDDAHRARTGRHGGWRLLAPLTIHMLETARRVSDTLHLRLGP